MIKDLSLKILFIPLLGLLLPLITGLVVLQHFGFTEIVYSAFYFLVLSCLIWQLTIKLTNYTRQLKAVSGNILKRLFFLSIVVSLGAALVSAMTALLWQKLFAGTYNKTAVITFGLSYAGTSLFIGLVYKILFLHKEVQLDATLMHQLDLERQYAEMHVLKNELDTHFIFNSLTALSHLIESDSRKAQLFNNRLAQVYKYLLVNKNRDLIPLEDELRFIKDYFYLLQIRHSGRLKLEIHIDADEARQVMILPCALQLLVENAIKHNCLAGEQPLQILVYLKKNHLCVANNLIGKDWLAPSMQVGLKNLSSRYRLISRQDISVNKTHESFLVKLPLIKPTEV